MSQNATQDETMPFGSEARPSQRAHGKRRVSYAEPPPDENVDGDAGGPDGFHGPDDAEDSALITAPALQQKRARRRSSGVGTSQLSQSSVGTQPVSEVRSQRTENLSQRERQQAAGTPRRLEYENGIIRCIKLENFKNHVNFEVRRPSRARLCSPRHCATTHSTAPRGAPPLNACAPRRRFAQLALGPHANFIKGANGSGKSSILAAIIVALGGNPNKHSGTAGGSKSTSGLVREGASYSSIELTLANGAEDPHYLDDGDAPESLVIRWRASLGSAGRTTQEYAACRSLSAPSPPMTLAALRRMDTLYSLSTSRQAVSY